MLRQRRDVRFSTVYTEIQRGIRYIHNHDWRTIEFWHTARLISFMFYGDYSFIFEVQRGKVKMREKNVRKNWRQNGVTTSDKSGSEAVFTGRTQADRIAHAAAINRVEFVSRPRRGRSKSPYVSRWTGRAASSGAREPPFLSFSAGPAPSQEEHFQWTTRATTSRSASALLTGSEAYVIYLRKLLIFSRGDTQMLRLERNVYPPKGR